MRIMIIGNFGRSWDGSICDEEHIAKALEEAGHEVSRLQREAAIIFNYGEKYDFILIAQWNGYGDKLIPCLREYGCPIVYWAFDYQYDKNDVPEPEEWHLRLACEADIFLSKELEHAATYRHLGANFHWLPQDFAPHLLHIYPREVEQDIDVLFTGSWLPWAPERTEYLQAVDKMFNLTIHSFTPEEWKREGFKNVHGPAMDDKLPKLVSRAKINLSLDWKHSEGYWSDRNAQIMACGGFVLGRYVPGMEIVFRNHVTYFHDIDSMLSGIKYFLDHEDERTERALFGHWYARENLMTRNRVNDLLVIVDNF